MWHGRPSDMFKELKIRFTQATSIRRRGWPKLAQTEIIFMNKMKEIMFMRYIS